MWGGCATFIPDEHGKVYISGGYQDLIPATMTDKIYAYDFETDVYELIGNTPETPVASHGCVGIKNSQNQKVQSSSFETRHRPFYVVKGRSSGHRGTR